MEENIERKEMTYVIIEKTDWGLELRHDVPGIKSLEKFTDSRILRIFKNAVAIYKLYENSRVIPLKYEF